MKRQIDMIIAVIRGKAIVITQNPVKEDTADVTIGKNISKRFAVRSFASALRVLTA